MSDGMRSGVNWMRLKLHPTDRASALASVVLPMPGTSSMSTWPSQSIATSASSIAASRPTMTRPTFSRTRAAASRMAAAAADRFDASAPVAGSRGWRAGSTLMDCLSPGGGVRIAW